MLFLKLEFSFFDCADQTWTIGPPPGIKPRNVEPTPKIEQSGWTSSEAETSNTDNQVSAQCSQSSLFT
jgi:hypothetical protein